MPVPTAEPSSGELPAGHAEGHAPAPASTSLTLEQCRKIHKVFRPHRPSFDICAHYGWLPVTQLEAPESFMENLAMLEKADDPVTTTTWLEHVTDEGYLA